MSVRWTGPREDVERGRAYLSSMEFEPAPVPWMPEAWSVGRCTRRRLSEVPWVTQQRLFMQSLSSMAAVMAMDIQPGHDVLDLCAAPGAKTSLIHRLQRGKGMLIANELSRARTTRLNAVLDRLECEGVEVMTGAGERLGGTHAACFDRVLADVPCSGEARFHLSNPSTWKRWSVSSITGLAKRQGALLESACRCARPGGEVLYATCTMAPEENELVVDRVLARSSVPMELLPISLPLPNRRTPVTAWDGAMAVQDLAHCARLVSDETMTPFFMARLRRTG